MTSATVVVDVAQPSLDVPPNQISQPEVINRGGILSHTLSHSQAAAALSGTSSQHQLIQGETSRQIPLERITAPVTVTASRSGSAPERHVRTQQNDVAQPSTHPPTRSGLAAWVYGRGHILWTWVMSIIMLALTAATYLVTKLQGIIPNWNFMLRSQEWQNDNKYYEYCNSRQSANKPLPQACQSVLEKGIDPPPILPSGKELVSRDSHPRGQNQSPSALSKAHSSARHALNGAEARVNRVKIFISTQTGIFVYARKFKRAMIRLFHGGRRLGTGQQTYALPTISSGIAALSMK